MEVACRHARLQKCFAIVLQNILYSSRSCDQVTGYESDDRSRDVAKAGWECDGDTIKVAVGSHPPLANYIARLV